MPQPHAQFAGPPPGPRDEPLAVRRMLAPIRSAAVGMFTSPFAGFALGAAAAGGVGVWSIVGGVLPLAIFGVRAAMLVRQRRELIERLKSCGWRACTACGEPLIAGAAACPNCRLEITGDEAAAAWMRSRWAQ